MSDTKTLPDGYVSSDYREDLQRGATCVQSLGDYQYSTPVCLVSPKLLDWVEKAKNELMVQSSSWARDLAIELESIEKEFKS